MHSTAVRTEDAEVRIWDKVRCKNLSHCRDLIDGGLDILCGLSSSKDGIIIEEFSDVRLRKPNEY